MKKKYSRRAFKKRDLLRVNDEFKETYRSNPSKRIKKTKVFSFDSEGESSTLVYSTKPKQDGAYAVRFGFASDARQNWMLDGILRLQRAMSHNN